MAKQFIWRNFIWRGLAVPILSLNLPGSPLATTDKHPNKHANFDQTSMFFVYQTFPGYSRFSTCYTNGFRLYLERESLRGSDRVTLWYYYIDIVNIYVDFIF